jgi:hypothetical protein
MQRSTNPIILSSICAVLLVSAFTTSSGFAQTSGSNSGAVTKHPGMSLSNKPLCAVRVCRNNQQQLCRGRKFGSRCMAVGPCKRIGQWCRPRPSRPR